RPPSSTLFPYTTLFRSYQHDLPADIDLQIFQLLEIIRRAIIGVDDVGFYVSRRRHRVVWHNHTWIILKRIAVHVLARRPMHPHRSEEHTSELQSLAYLV